MKLSERLVAAREALDSMDDFARMEASIDPVGPRTVLEDFIEAAAELARRVEDVPKFTAERVTAAGMTWVGVDVTGHVEYGQRVRLVPEAGLGVK